MNLIHFYPPLIARCFTILKNLSIDPEVLQQVLLQHKGTPKTEASYAPTSSSALSTVWSQRPPRPALLPSKSANAGGSSYCERLPRKEQLRLADSRRTDQIGKTLDSENPNQSAAHCSFTPKLILFVADKQNPKRCPPLKPESISLGCSPSLVPTDLHPNTIQAEKSVNSVQA